MDSSTDGHSSDDCKALHTRHKATEYLQSFGHFYKVPVMTHSLLSVVSTSGQLLSILSAEIILERCNATSSVNIGTKVT